MNSIKDLIDNLEQETKEAPTPKLYFKLARANFQIREYDEAIKECQKGIALPIAVNGNCDKVYKSKCFYMLISSLCKKKDKDVILAESLCLKVIDARRFDTFSRKNKCKALSVKTCEIFNCDECEFANDKYSRHIITNRETYMAAALSRLGRIYRNKGDNDQSYYEKSIAYFNRVIDDKTRHPQEHADAYNGLAHAYRNKGFREYLHKDGTPHLELAWQSYEKAINLGVKYNFDTPFAYYNRGAISASQGLYEKAIKDFASAIKQYPEYAHAYNRLGKALFDIEGIKDEKYDSLRKILGLNGYPQTAIAAFNIAIALDKKYPYPYFNLAEAYIAAGKDNVSGEVDGVDEGPCDINFQKAKESYLQARHWFGHSHSLGTINDEYFIPLIDNACEDLDALALDSVGDKDVAFQVLKNTAHLPPKIRVEKRLQDQFYNHRAFVRPSKTLTFTCLRKWNSYTPIAGGGLASRKGGGYFIQSGKKGIVVDPGFNFIENFISLGYTFNAITDVIITHAHIDHTSDIESIITALYTYNKNLEGGNIDDTTAELEENGVLREVLKHKGVALRDIREKNLEKRKEVEAEVKRRYNDRKKTISFWITKGLFQKWPKLFDLTNSAHKLNIIDPNDNRFFSIGDIQVRVLHANHNDQISTNTAVGLCFEQGDFVLVHTGDTSFREDMKANYETLHNEIHDGPNKNQIADHLKSRIQGYGGSIADADADVIAKEIFDKTFNKAKIRRAQKNVVLVANIGGIKDKERRYLSEPDAEKHYYTNHLGRLGLAHIAETLKPDLCVISEFGVEFDGVRRDMAKAFETAFDTAGVESTKKIKMKFLPADIGLRIERGCANNDISQEDNNIYVHAIDKVAPIKHSPALYSSINVTGNDESQLLYYSSLEENLVKEIGTDELYRSLADSKR